MKSQGEDAHVMRSSSQISWPLIWLALLVLSVGLLLFTLLRKNTLSPSAPLFASLSLGLSLLGAGLLVVIATHRWWFNH